MTKKGGNIGNLDPVRSKEEARKRGANGGKKSGEVRRKKRDAKHAISILLQMPPTETVDDELKQLGFLDEEITNMSAMVTKMFQKAISGDVSAFKVLMDYGGFHPDQKNKNAESKQKIKILQEPSTENENSIEKISEDVLIYVPEKDSLEDGEES